MNSLRRAVALVFAGLSLFAQAPEVLKVEPPGWWAGHSVNPVRVMIRGRNLTGTHVRVDGPGLRAGSARASASGTYLFVDITIQRRAKPGQRSIHVSTADGSTQATFEVLQPLSRQGRFQGFSSADVFYLIIPDRFANGDQSNDGPLHNRADPRFYHGGDLEGIIQKLPYLKDLGVTTLWLTPLYDNANVASRGRRPFTDYHGYGAVDLYAVDEHFGNIAKLRELADRAHASGMKIVLDQVANHTGPLHPWVQDPPTPTWFNGTPESHLANTWQTWTLADPYSAPAMRKATLEGWFIDLLPDLNQDDPEVASYLIQNTLWWIGVSGIDGIRQDTLPYVPRHFWRDWTDAIKREYPNLKVVGEVYDEDPSLVSFFQGGVKRQSGIDTGIDALFDFPLYFSIRRSFSEGKPLREAALMLGRDHLYPNPAMLLTFLGLHDVPRFAKPEGLKLAFTFLLTARGIPLIYYGDEIGMEGGGDPDNRRDFPGGWPDDPRNAFEASARTASEQSIWEHVRKLTTLRRESEALQRGRMVHLAVTEQFFAYARLAENETVVIAINNGAEPVESELGLSVTSSIGNELGGQPLREKGRVSLGPRSAGIYRIK